MPASASENHSGKAMSEARKTTRPHDADQAPRVLSEAARRALAEAAARREAAVAENRPEERGGRGGLDPARYGDWEVKGVASDF